MNQPLCFVLMPFGRKPATAGHSIDFDAVYQELIAPAVTAAGLMPLRADEELVGGLIHKPMYERLILCEYAIADLTTANANVFYELGLRHAVRPASTLLIFARDSERLPFDVAPLRGLSYVLGPDGKPTEIDTTVAALKDRLDAAREHLTDSPLFQLVDGYPDIQRLKTDVFRDRVDYSERIKQQLAQARQAGVEQIRALEQSLLPIADVEAGVVIDLFLSYRSVKAWQDMIDLVARMSKPLATTSMVQEQLGFALNRAGQGQQAETVLLDVIAKRGPSSETFGLLGRVYKDRWEAALKAGAVALAQGLLRKAINAYRQGFEADWRDAYPGVNAVTLMELAEPPDPARAKLLPVVSYAVERRLASGRSDYWDQATLLELAVLARNEHNAREALANALALVRDVWEPETTARNLRLIREARQRRGESDPWAQELEEALLQKNSA